MADSPSSDEIAQLVAGWHGDPFHLLGPQIVDHDGAPMLVVRALIPWAESMALLVDDARLPMARIHATGLFEGLLPGRDWDTRYRLWAQAPGAWPAEFDDPYAFPSPLTN